MDTVDHSVRIAGEAVRQALATRNNYTKSDIEFVSASLLSDSEDKITLEIVAKFCIRTYIYSNTGRYSFSFNAILKRVVDIRNARAVRMLALMPDDEAFPEVYKNTMLLDQELTTILTMTKREYLASVNMINMAVASTNDSLTLFGVSRSELLYDKAYKYTALQELVSEVDFPVLSTVPKKIKIKGQIEGTDELHLEVREVDYLYFIMQLSREAPVIRDIRLRGDILDFMKRKYSPEIKLCQYWNRNPV